MKKKILIIDDDKDFCEVTKAMLHHTMRYQVLTAHSGLAGIQMARKHRPDVILLDVKMPGMDGGRVAEHLSDDDLTNFIPIVFLTGFIRQEEVDKDGGYIAGRLFIAKPFKLDKLTAIIDTVTV